MSWTRVCESTGLGWWQGSSGCLQMATDPRHQEGWGARGNLPEQVATTSAGALGASGRLLDRAMRGSALPSLRGEVSGSPGTPSHVCPRGCRARCTPTHSPGRGSGRWSPGPRELLNCTSQPLDALPPGRGLGPGETCEESPWRCEAVRTGHSLLTGEQLPLLTWPPGTWECATPRRCVFRGDTRVEL